uniref:TIP41-like protein n=1 Tax=Heterorhabditis bacteriophora TaxID=37862 RepID=A0A1I7W686_HETBA
MEFRVRHCMRGVKFELSDYCYLGSSIPDPKPTRSEHPLTRIISGYEMTSRDLNKRYRSEPTWCGMVIDTKFETEAIDSYTNLS